MDFETINTADADAPLLDLERDDSEEDKEPYASPEYYCCVCGFYDIWDTP